jgi:hypothetical protein
LCRLKSPSSSNSSPAKKIFIQTNQKVIPIKGSSY